MRGIVAPVNVRRPIRDSWSGAVRLSRPPRARRRDSWRNPRMASTRLRSRGRLFGAGSGARWAALLPGVLGGDDRLGIRRRPLAPGAAPCSPRARTSRRRRPTPFDDAGPIMTLALATTGADPRRHRIARIAVVRHEHGEVTARLDCVVGTGRRLSRYLRDAARVSLDDLDDAPYVRRGRPGAARARGRPQASMRTARGGHRRSSTPSFDVPSCRPSTSSSSRSTPWSARSWLVRASPGCSPPPTSLASRTTGGARRWPRPSLAPGWWRASASDSPRAPPGPA